MVIKLSVTINLNSLWLPIKVMNAIISDQTNKIIEINLIWPTYGGFNAWWTLLLLSNMRQIAQRRNSISFYSIVDYTALVRWTTMKTVCDIEYVHTPFCFWFNDDQKVNSSLLLFHYPSPHFKKYVSRWRLGERTGSNLWARDRPRARPGPRSHREYSMCLYKIIFMFDNSLHNDVNFLLCR